MKIPWDKILSKVTVKHVAFALIFLLISGLCIQSCRLLNASRDIDDMNSQMIILNSTLHSKLDSIKILEQKTLELRSKSDSLIAVSDNLKKTNRVLNTKLKNALANIDSIPPDDNYRYLQDTAYFMFSGENKYPFSGEQVTEIRKTFAEREYLEKINVNLNLQVDVLHVRVVYKDSIIGNQDKEIVLYKNVIKDLNKLVVIQKDQNKQLTKEVKRETRKKTVYQTIGAGAILYIIIGIL